MHQKLSGHIYDSKTLKKIINDADFHLFWLKATKIATELGIEKQQPPRQHKKTS